MKTAWQMAWACIMVATGCHDRPASGQWSANNTAAARSDSTALARGDADSVRMDERRSWSSTKRFFVLLTSNGRLSASPAPLANSLSADSSVHVEQFRHIVALLSGLADTTSDPASANGCNLDAPSYIVTLYRAGSVRRFVDTACSAPESLDEAIGAFYDAAWPPLSNGHGFR